MIAKHIAMHSLAKSSFAGLVNYITDNQSKEHRLGEVTITNCGAYDLDIAVIEVEATQKLNTRAKSDKTFHLLVSFRPDEKPSISALARYMKIPIICIFILRLTKSTPKL